MTGPSPSPRRGRLGSIDCSWALLSSPKLMDRLPKDNLEQHQSLGEVRSVFLVYITLAD